MIFKEMFKSTKELHSFHCHSRPLMMESRWKSNIESAPNCPRCASPNTKFCYYNNYSLSQPRYLCKGCRRYWTKGGSLRNVAVGGGCRKIRRARSAHLAKRSGSTYRMHSPGDGPASHESDGTTDGVNIDLAAVFAKFLNQDSSNSDNTIEMDQGSSKDASSSLIDLIPTSFDGESTLENFMLESRVPSNLIDPELPQMRLDMENVDEVLDYNCNAIELQAIPEDGVVDQEILWSDCLNLPIFEEKPHLQFQEFGLVPLDDESRIASNGPFDHWCF